jgi:hypothetical protein
MSNEETLDEVVKCAVLGQKFHSFNKATHYIVAVKR